ncbi:hypothetical protein JW859_06865 [bacterium]|nr:hypothetical protein [bacterium]
MRTTTVLSVIARLKWLLTIRHYRRRWETALAMGFSLLVLLGVAVAGGTFLFVFAREQGPGFRDTAFLWIAWITSIIWISSPVLQFDVQRSLDLNGLRLLPLSRLSFTLAVLLDAALSPLGLFFLPVLLITLVALSLTALDAVVMVVALLLLVTCWLGLGQSIYLWANKLLQSRRFADASIAIGVVLFLIIQGINLAFQSSDQLSLPPWLHEVWHWVAVIFKPLISWLFPGLAARLVSEASAGNWLQAALVLILLAGQAAVCAWLAQSAARAFYEGELDSGGSAQPVRTVRRTGRRVIGTGLFGVAEGALFHRERIYLARDPLFKMMLIQSLFGALYFVFVAVFISFRGRDDGIPFFEGFRQYALLGVALMLSFIESGVLFNKYGFEGGLLTNVLLSPVDRRRLLVAKSTFYMLHFAGINIALVIGLGIILRTPLSFAVAAVVIVATNTAIVDVAGHFVSIYLPFTYQRQGRRMRPVMPQPGCGYMFIYMLVFQACNLAVLPGTFLVGAGAIFFGWPGVALGGAAAILLAGLAYRFGLPYAARILESREPELLAALVKRAD